mmetsp:Transcript_29935/g.79761  ORF Transcript_29935/g.79761 Transcript_29935/m.79761 type:complete len:203 (-) Transcript_29935:496-1104(-)
MREKFCGAVQSLTRIVWLSSLDHARLSGRRPLAEAPRPFVVLRTEHRRLVRCQPATDVVVPVRLTRRWIGAHRLAARRQELRHKHLRRGSQGGSRPWDLANWCRAQGPHRCGAPCQRRGGLPMARDRLESGVLPASRQGPLSWGRGGIHHRRGAARLCRRPQRSKAYTWLRLPALRTELPGILHAIGLYPRLLERWARALHP